MTLYKNSLASFFALILLLLAMPSQSQTTEDPYQKIESVSQQLVEIIGAHQKEYPKNEKQYFDAISNLMNGLVDFRYIAKKVMGPYKAMATQQQIALFAQIFRQGLIETYSRGLINYKDQKIVLVEQKPLKKGQRTLIVKQEIRSSGNVFPLRYFMARKKTGEWMVINMSISGINLRDIFSNQFLQAAQKSKGDLDIVITGWTSEID
ncbi:MAG: MlaC/ttg2D family ABC transporter substrate-binding protein [Porticoccaceae bacterium]|jgi:phospholipid transport system substrate-binding protein